VYILYLKYVICMCICLCEKVQNTVCFVPSYLSCYPSILMSQSAIVQFCVCWCSELLQFTHLLYKSLYSKPSVQPQHRKNAILRRNITACHRWTDCTSSTTRRPAATQQILGREQLWKARPWTDMRTGRTALLQRNAASLCYLYAMAVKSVGEWPNCDQDCWSHVFCPSDTWFDVCILYTMHCYTLEKSL
jgi:hypothetical protein